MRIAVVSTSTGRRLAYTNGNVPANGDIRARQRQTLVWECGTSFTLEIQDYTRNPNAANNEYPAAFEHSHNAGSPFAATSYSSGAGGTLGQQISQDVVNAPQAGVYKYSLTVTDPAGGPDVTDDPQIIID